MSTYAALQPPTSHWRPATCAEVDCQPYLHGWETSRTPDGLPLSPDQVEQVRALRGLYHFVETRDEEGVAVFTFPPGQPCFRAAFHRVPLERPAVLLARRGFGPARRYDRADQWFEDMQGSVEAAQRRREGS